MNRKLAIIGVLSIWGGVASDAFAQRDGRQSDSDRSRGGGIFGGRTANNKRTTGTDRSNDTERAGEVDILIEEGLPTLSKGGLGRNFVPDGQTDKCPSNENYTSTTDANGDKNVATTSKDIFLTTPITLEVGRGYNLYQTIIDNIKSDERACLQREPWDTLLEFHGFSNGAVKAKVFSGRSGEIEFCGHGMRLEGGTLTVTAELAAACASSSSKYEAVLIASESCTGLPAVCTKGAAVASFEIRFSEPPPPDLSACKNLDVGKLEKVKTLVLVSAIGSTVGAAGSIGGGIAAIGANNAQARGDKTQGEVAAGRTNLAIVGSAFGVAGSGVGAGAGFFAHKEFDDLIDQMNKCKEAANRMP